MKRIYWIKTPSVWLILRSTVFRQSTHINARTGSGGVGIYVRNSLYQCYNIEIADRSYDGIIVVQLEHKQTNCKIVVFSVYLPPENSHLGRDASSFYSYILSQVYLHANAEAVIICGDMNARVGSLPDTIPEIDNIPERQILDKTINQHGHTFLEFLSDSKTCILNGRFQNEHNNFTSVSSKGRAVVDYMCVPHDGTH